jgi:hypothetical protein
MRPRRRVAPLCSAVPVLRCDQPLVYRASPDVETELGIFPSKDAAMPAFQGGDRQA